MRLHTSRRRAAPRRFAFCALVGLLLLASVVTPALAAPAPPADSVRLLASDDQAVRLDLVTPPVALVQTTDATGAACAQANLAGFVQSAEQDRPQLPVKVILLGVPPDADLSLEVHAAPARPLDGVACGVIAGADTPASARLVDLGFLRGQRIARLELYPVLPGADGRLAVSDQISVAVRFSPRADVAAAYAPAAAEPEAYEAELARSLLNYDAARAWRGQPLAADAAAAAWTPPQPGYKVLVREEGLYHLTKPALAAAGLPVDQLDPRGLRMFAGGKEIAIRVTGEADGKLDAADAVLFFGQPANTRYTEANVYWLTYGGAAGKRMAGRAAGASGPVSASFLTAVKKEENSAYLSALPRLPGYDHWYGQEIKVAGAGSVKSVNVSVATPQLASGALTASLDAVLGSITAGQHRARLYVNPSANPGPVWEGTWDGPNITTINATFPQSYLSATANNTVKIEVVNDPGRIAEVVRVDWVRVGYQRSYIADNDQLFFGGDTPGSRRYEVSGFTTDAVDLYDVTDPDAPALLTPGTGVSKLYLPLVLRQKPAAGALATAEAAPALAPRAFTLAFGDNQPTARRYLALSAARRLAPVSITLDQPSTLQAASQGADYIIISHADFTAAVTPLAAARAAQGKRVKVIDVQDIYDEFGGGLMSAEAIRDFIAYAYANWTRPAPSSVLLVGDGTYDFRGYKYTAPTFVPPYLDMVDPDAGETATDNRFVAVTKNGGAYDMLPDLDIGRLPANTAAEASAMVSKILAYGQLAPDPWTRQVLFVSDDLEGGGGNFYAYSDGIADGSATHKGSTVKILPAPYVANKVYLGQTCDLSNPATSVECKAQIVSKINAGALMVSYIGHGTKTYWAAEQLYNTAALASLTNGARQPIMLPMTCNEGYFVDPAEASLSEQSLRRADGGSIASWSPTGYGLAPGHDYLERGLFLAMYHDGLSLGAGATSAKLYMIANAPPGAYDDLVDTFLLLGDPALELP